MRATLNSVLRARPSMPNSFFGTRALKRSLNPVKSKVPSERMAVVR